MNAAFLNRPCPACGSNTHRNVIHSEPRAESMSFEALRPFWAGLFKEKVFFSYDRCQTCGLLFTPTFYDQEHLAELYSNMAPNMDLVPSEALERTQRGYFDAAVEADALDGGYLEIGPDVGSIVGHAALEGRFDHFWLFEPNQAVHSQLAAATSGKPHDILADMTDLSAVPDASIGLAVMIHVLDHLIDPMATLRQILAKLRPDGKLLIVTHNEHSLLRTLMGTRWPPFCLQHPEIYNPTSMKEVLGRAGYGAVAISRSKNYFPLAFMARQTIWTLGLRVEKLPLPNISLGLKLGNMLTLASR